MENRARLLTFTIDLNRDANLEVEIDRIDTAQFESVIRKLGDPQLGHKISRVVLDYFRLLENYVQDTARDT